VFRQEYPDRRVLWPLSFNRAASAISTSEGPSHLSGDASRYIFLFATQTTGAAILFWHGMPLVRQVLLDPGSHVPRTENLVWSLSAIALMHAGYWIRH
jgi:hypothetical protein